MIWIGTGSVEVSLAAFAFMAMPYARVPVVIVAATPEASFWTSPAVIATDAPVGGDLKTDSSPLRSTKSLRSLFSAREWECLGNWRCMIEGGELRPDPREHLCGPLAILRMILCRDAHFLCDGFLLRRAII